MAIDGIVGPQTEAALRTAALAGGRPPPALRPGAGYRSQSGSGRVLEVQRILSSLRYDAGPLDGLFGPRTQAAVQWFQVHQGLPPTGIVDQRTFTRLRTLSRGSPGIDGAAASAELKVPPLPAAGWHGRPIRNPHPHTSVPTPGSVEHARPLQLGAGYGSALGSQRVRRLQRDLRRAGYRPGPVDGRFGPRTKASVQWFQMKEGLRPRGSVDAATLGQLRALTSSDEPTQPHRKRATAPTAPSLAARPPRAVTPRDADEGTDGISAQLILLGAAFGVAALALMTLTKRWPRRAQPVPPADPTPSTNSHAGAGDRKPPAPAPQTNGHQGSQRAVGYASAQDPAELERQAAAIERACDERGWTLACVIRENGSPNGNGRKRPGLVHAAKQIRAGLAARIVVASLDDLGHSEDELRAQLVSAGADDVELVALDANGHGTPKSGRAKRAVR
jgi:peptidoglycan hydrolase-like protein with peptidoglycan-binding domain